MPTAVEMTWIAGSAKFTAVNQWDVQNEIRDARFPCQSVSNVTLDCRTMPGSREDILKALSKMLAVLKPFMGFEGRISITGIALTSAELTSFSKIGGAPVSARAGRLLPPEA